MSWSTKEKTILDSRSQKIITPDGSSILVGAGQNLVLIWRELIDEWGQSTKQPSSWGLKAWDQTTRQSSSWSFKTRI